MIHADDAAAPFVAAANARLRRDLGWTPRYPTWREGTAQVVEAWRREGFPPRIATG